MATAVALTACAGQGDGQGDAAQGRAVFNQLVTQIYGAPNQRAAAHELAFLTAQQAIARCTAKVGVTYGITPYLDVESAVISPGDLPAFAPLRSDFGVGERIQRLAAAGEPANPGLAEVSSAEEEHRWWAALENCQTEADQGNSLSSPPGQEELEERFVTVLKAVQDRVLPDLSAEYASCMKESGIDARDVGETYMAVEQAYPGVSYQQPSDVTKLPGWADAVAFEENAAAADTACRADYLDVAMAAALPDLTRFAAANKTTLSDHAARWSHAGPQLADLRAQLRITD